MSYRKLFEREKRILWIFVTRNYLFMELWKVLLKSSKLIILKRKTHFLCFLRSYIFNPAKPAANRIAHDLFSFMDGFDYEKRYEKFKENKVRFHATIWDKTRHKGSRLRLMIYVYMKSKTWNFSNACRLHVGCTKKITSDQRF